MAPIAEFCKTKDVEQVQGSFADDLQDEVKALNLSLAESQASLKMTKDALAIAQAKLENMVPKLDLATAKTEAKNNADLADKLQAKLNSLKDDLDLRNVKLARAEEARDTALAKLEDMSHKVNLNAGRSDAKIYGLFGLCVDCVVLFVPSYVCTRSDVCILAIDMNLPVHLRGFRMLHPKLTFNTRSCLQSKDANQSAEFIADMANISSLPKNDGSQ